MDELDFAVKYPFSESARKSLEGVELNERIVELALIRIKKAITGDSSAKMLLHENEKKDDIASFAAARMILGFLHNNFLTNRFAVNESKIVRGYLDRENEDLVDKIGEIFAVLCAKENGRMTISIPNYLKSSPRALEYRLINRRIVGGKVEIKGSEKRRLIEEAVKKHNENLPLVKDPPEIVKTAGAKLLLEMPKSESKVVIKSGDHPPCIMKLLEEAKKHENLPHHARWYLATYLLGVGMSEDNIIKVYSDLPDFNEKVTSYQVAHIKKKGYNVPSCATVMTYGLCCAVCRIGHPMNWHTLSDERKKEVKK